MSRDFLFRPLDGLITVLFARTYLQLRIDLHRATENNIPNPMS